MAAIDTLPSGSEVHSFDPASALIFPAIEHFIPFDLEYELRRLRSGDWRCNILTPQRMLRLELLQACRPDFSFQETLREVWQVWRCAGCFAGSMPNSASLAEARARLPAWTLEALFKHTAALADRSQGPSPWPGHRLLAIDGTLLAVPNTPLHRAHFGIAQHQHGEAYYPQALAVWLSLLSGGTILAEHLGPSREGEESIAPKLLPVHLRCGDLVLGDARFGTYAVIAQTIRSQAYFLFRAPGPLQVDKHVLQRFTPDDADLRLPLTPYMRQRHITLALPDQLSLRAVSFNIPARDLLNGIEHAHFLTNLPRDLFSTAILSRIAQLRWGHETTNNDIKTRLGLGDIRSQNPAGVRREVLAHLCMANILHLLLAQAHPDTPLNGSFTSARSALYLANQQLRLAPQRRSELLELLREMIIQQPLDLRPSRSEPRMARPSTRPHRIFKTARSEWRAQRKAG